MKKTITICDSCGKEIEELYTILAVRQKEDGGWAADPDTSKRPDLCKDCVKLFQDFVSPQALQRVKHTEQQEADQPDPEEDSAPPSADGQGTIKEQQDAAKEKQAPEKEKAAALARQVDHGRIVALYTANPPRSIKWIADDCKCSEQTVINHLVKEGLYKTQKERRAENKKENKNDE